MIPSRMNASVAFTPMNPAPSVVKTVLFGKAFSYGRGNTVRLGHVRPLPGPRAHIQPLLSAAILTIPVTMTNAAQRPSNVHIKIPLGLRQLMAWSRIGRPMENVDELASEPRLASAPSSLKTADRAITA
jgi:hypothetical protein